MAKKLSKTMSVQQFKNGYWYATDLKDFAHSLGIPSINSLRKDQIEKLIIGYLKNGKVSSPKARSKRSDIKDLEKGLSLKLPIINYTSNAETKNFLMKEALKLDPKLPKRSGVRYWLNRWREEQIENGRKITYGDLVRQFVKLSQSKEPFPQIPSTRFNNFISDYLKSEKGSTKAAANKAWEKLKKLDIPKNYQSWVKYHGSKK